MPGSPDPVLGSMTLTIGVSIILAAVLVALPLLGRSQLVSRRLALGGGLGYALVCLAAWAGARAVTDAFVSGLIEQPASLVVLVVVGAVVLGVQAAVPIYLYDRWGLVAPLAGLFGATSLILVTFLQVRGESDPLGLYVLVFGPMAIGLLVVVGLGEIAIRRAVAALGR